MYKLLMTIIAMLLPSMALAHSGHGHVESSSIWHWLLEFDHIGWVAVLFLAGTGLIAKRYLTRHS